MEDVGGPIEKMEGLLHGGDPDQAAAAAAAAVATTAASAVDTTAAATAVAAAAVTALRFRWLRLTKCRGHANIGSHARLRGVACVVRRVGGTSRCCHRVVY